MTSLGLWFLLSPLVAMAGQGSETRPACAPELAAVVADVLRQTGPSYVAARDRLLGRDAVALRACLEARRREADDPLEQLVIEALLARMARGRAVDELLQEALASLSENASTTAPAGTRPHAHEPVRPSQVALLLAERLGGDAAALVGELLVKELVRDWAMPRRQALVLTLTTLGHVRQAHGKLTPAREPRAGYVLLWLLEHEADEPTRRLAAQGLRRFASPPMIAAVRALEARVRTGPGDPQAVEARRAIITQCLRGMEAEQRILERLGTAQTSQPASGPAR